MSNYAKKFGRRGYESFGRTHYLQSPGMELQWVTFNDFTGGYSAADAKEDTEARFTPEAIDTLVTEDDRLTVVPGTVLEEIMQRSGIEEINYSSFPNGPPAGQTHFGTGSSSVVSGKLINTVVNPQTMDGVTLNDSTGAFRVLTRCEVIDTSATGPAGGAVLLFTYVPIGATFLGFRIKTTVSVAALPQNSGLNIQIAGSRPGDATLVNTTFLAGFLPANQIVVTEAIYTPGVGPAAGTLQFRTYPEGAAVPAFVSIAVDSYYAALSGQVGLVDITGVFSLVTNTRWLSIETESEPPAATPEKVVLHTSLDYTSDLVFFDPPFIGVKHEGDTEWFDVGIPVGNHPYQAINFGGTLLFSNGNIGLYAREVGGETVELIEGAPAARAYASFAGRVFAAHAIIDGNRQPLGIRWSAATSDHHDWDLFDSDGVATGAGFELLIDEMAAGDAIVALRPMGLDLMAIFLRHSIWIGRKTNNYLRPMDPQPRVPGVGAITGECCRTTRFGVVFLADGPGVYLFDGNSAQLISEPITKDLKALTRVELASCTAEYNLLNRCYYLFTPNGTLVFDFERKRWHKRSLIARGATVFSTQFTAITWGEITGTWGSKDEVWQDLSPQEADDLEFYFLGDRDEQRVLDKEDLESFSNFSTLMEPSWEFPLREGLYSTQMVTTKQVILNHDAPGLLELHLPDETGAYAEARTAELLEGRDSTPVFGENTGKGGGLKLVFLEGDKPRLSRVQLGLILRGPRIEPLL